MPSKKKRYTFSHNGKQYSVFADSIDEASEKIAKKKAELEKPSSDMTLYQLYNATIDTHTINQKESSKDKTKYMIEHYILDEIGHMKVEDISERELQAILNSNKGKSKTVINYIYNGMRYLWRVARQRKIVTEDITEFLVKPKGTTKHRRALTEEERIAVIEVAKTKRMYYGYLLMILCGCRPSEAYEVKRNDIALKNGKPILHIRGTKTKASDRFVPMPKELYQIVENLAPSDYICLSEGGNKVGGNFSRRWKHFTYHVNRYMGAKTYRNSLIEHLFGEDLSPYNLRHEYCTNLARLGIDIRVAQKLMGHTTIKMTADIYTDLDQGSILAVADMLYAPTYVPKSL